MSRTPQNPYGSYLLSASAGCGKTYQLSRRFLYLVGAGAKPGEILAITFTKKAASEMSQRIIGEAARLLRDPDAARDFDLNLQSFHQSFCRTAEHALTPPRSAQKTGQTLLASTQQLRITTIDSTFWEWVRKFPWEASGINDEGGTPLPPGFDLITRQESAEYYDQAFNRLVQKLFVDSSVDLPASFFSNQGLYGLKNRFDQLHGFSTYLWLQRRLRNDQAPLNPYSPSSLLPENCDTETIMGLLAEPLAEILPLVNAQVAEEVQAALHAKDWQALWRSKFIKTTDAAISGTYLRGKKKDSVAPAVARCEDLLRAYTNMSRVAHLNQFGGFLLELFHGYSQYRDELKFKDGRVEFGDLARGCFRLFHDIEAMGARFLINQTTRHLLLDEFQDTSRLQWSVFSPLARELLAGEGSHSRNHSPPPSVFIVGDTKQSIYGFREADPAVLGEAAEELRDFGLESLPLNESYRTAPRIMMFVNEVFKQVIAEFPQHTTAVGPDGEPVSADCGWIAVSPLFADDPPEELSAAEQEAEYVATYLEAALAAPEQHPVFDKALGGYRPLKAKDCAILYRNSTRAHLFETALRERGVACIREQTDGFFARQEILDIRALIRWLAHPGDLVALVQCLRSPLGNIDDRACLIALEQAKETSDNLLQRCEQLLVTLETVDHGVASAFRAWWRESAQQKPTVLLEQIYRSRGVPERFRQHFGPGEGDLAAANLLQFLELIYQMEGGGSLAWAIIDRGLTELAEQGQIGNAPTTSNAVSLMTIHKSKGLEFPLVILVDAGGPWEKRDRYWVKGKHPTAGDGVYYTGSKEEQPIRHAEFDQVHACIDAQLREESYRLLYVALTRARQYLMVTGHKPKRNSGVSQGRSTGFHGDVCRAFATLLDQPLEEEQPGFIDFRQPVAWCSPPAAPDPIPRPQAGCVPPLAEVFSVSPHVGSQDQNETATHSATGQDPEVARLRGLLIHGGLEAKIKAETWHAERQWNSFNPGLGYEDKFAVLFPEAAAEVEAVWSSELFQNLVRPPNRLHPEVPFCSLDKARSSQLVRGRIDLVVEAHDEILVIDYKTAAEAARAENHRQQLAAYCQAWLQIANSTKPVRGYVLFTATTSLQQVWPVADS